MTKPRPVTITVASVMFIVYGIITIVTSVLIGILASALFSTSGSGPGAIVFSLIIFVTALIGVLDIVAGYGLWHMNRWAAIMGMILNIFGVAGQGLVYSLFGFSGSISGLALSSYGAAGGSWVNALLLFLIAIVWRTFEPSEPNPATR